MPMAALPCIPRMDGGKGSARWPVTVLAVALAACHGPSMDRPNPPPVHTAAAISDEGGIPIEAGASVEAGASTEAGAPPAPSPPEPGIRKVPVGAAKAPVRSICFVQGDCRGSGALDGSSFVELEQSGGISCQALGPPSTCANLAGTTPIAEEAGFSPLCALAIMRERTPPEGGRPRDQAREALRRVAAKRAPCTGEPPEWRLRYHVYCDDYRADGTLRARSYFGQIAGGGERIWFQEIDEKGRTTREFTDCDAGHN